MEGTSNIIDLLRKALENDEEIYSKPCKVISVDEGELTCDVEPLDGDAEVLGVRLGSSVDSGFYCVPEEDSIVLVSFISKEAAFVSAFGKVEKVVFTASDKLVIKSEKESLKDLLEETLDAIQQITVPTGTGPSGTPVNATVFSQLSQRVSNLLEE